MVRISFYGDRGAGKTVLAKGIQQMLEEKNVTVHRETRRDDSDVLHIDNDFDPAAFLRSLVTERSDAKQIGQVTLKLDTQLMPYCELIRSWAEARNLIAGSNSQAQTVKLFEEGGEVASAVARGNRDALKDGIGDMIVILTILAAQNDLTVEECVAAAYDEIKDRKGRMVDGVFVREQ